MNSLNFRFKFDVWSNDVNLANQMESSGRPGMVHISEKTRAFLRDEYFVEDGDHIKGKTDDKTSQTYIALWPF